MKYACNNGKIYLIEQKDASKRQWKIIKRYNDIGQVVKATKNTALLSDYMDHVRKLVPKLPFQIEQ